MNLLDIIFGLIFLILIFYGFKNGLIKIALFFTSCLIGWILSSIFTPSIIGVLPKLSLDINIISGIIYFVLIIICILITSSLTKPLKSILSLATFGFSSLIDRIGGIIIGVIFAFAIITISIISLSRITYHFEVSNSNVITNYASETPFIKNKINNIENQFINSKISLNSIKLINSLNLHKTPFVPVSFSNSFEILNNNVYK
tara:strand:- start:1223 stop:1828 length:606 start_codon:yes stop_codon:yes gene_type:complete